MLKKVLFFVFLFSMGFLIRVYQEVNYSYQGEPQVISIKNGSTFPGINQELFKNNIVKNRRVFHYISKYLGKMNSLKAGSYQITNGMTYFEMIDLLSEGNSLGTSITIPEGKNIYEITESLLRLKLIDNKKSFLSKLRNKDLNQKFDLPGSTLEGFLFPDTYNIPLGSSEDQIISQFINNFKAKTKALNFKNETLSFFEIITLASIVEKETGAKFERKTIAGVFFNRLKKKMKLQSDPTIIYGMFEKYDGNIRRKDIHAPTPYNTYTVKALPIGPIANPGLDAIKAVLEPESHDYLYFVSKNNGTHKFTKNYKDHLKAVKKWQLTKKNKKGRSWRDLQQ